MSRTARKVRPALGTATRGRPASPSAAIAVTITPTRIDSLTSPRKNDPPIARAPTTTVATRDAGMSGRAFGAEQALRSRDQCGDDQEQYRKLRGTRRRELPADDGF